MEASAHAFTLCQAHHQQQGQDVIAANVDEVRRLGVNIWRVQQVLVHLPQHATRLLLLPEPGRAGPA